ncbi:hypothetical protein [Arenibacter sp. NBRC 103722]|uniref:hypothetical protein n=1 Tax=Arenibacter sp. NBRC 103722 TaxID=1113929 RepID=UPI0011AF7D24|nr:hypothetical protein [Arenibacter sp. NBRC 103722]
MNLVCIISHNVRGPISILQGLIHLYELEKEVGITLIMDNINKRVDTLDRTIVDLNDSLNPQNAD